MSLATCRSPPRPPATSSTSSPAATNTARSSSPPTAASPAGARSSTTSPPPPPSSTGGGDGDAVEALAPAGDAAVGGEDDRAVFVAAGDDVEEVAGGLGGERQVAKLIDQQELRAVPEAHRCLPASFEDGALGAGDEVGGGRVVDAVAGLDRLAAERDCEHRFADAGRPDQQDVAVLLDEAERGELFDHAAVERRLGVVVDVGERLLGREAGEAEPALEPAPLDRLHLESEQPLEEARVRRLSLLGVLKGGGELLGDRAEPQVGEVGAQLLVDALLGHRAAASAA